MRTSIIGLLLFAIATAGCVQSPPPASPPVVVPVYPYGPYRPVVPVIPIPIPVGPHHPHRPRREGEKDKSKSLDLPAEVKK